MLLQSEQGFLCRVKAKREHVNDTLLQARDASKSGKKERRSDDRWEEGVNTSWCKGEEEAAEQIERETALSRSRQGTQSAN